MAVTINGESASKQRDKSKCCYTCEGKDSHGYPNYYKCERPTKFVNPDGKYICGIHARAENLMYERIGSEARCLPIAKGKK